MSRPHVPDRPVRVLVVDDHQVVHWGLQIMLSRLSWVQEVFCARTADEALTIARHQRPQLAVVDLLVGQDSGTEICERLHVASPGVRVLLISGAGQISPRAAAACGADGFVAKDARGVDILRAVRAVARGESAFSESLDPPGPSPALSEREREVLALLATGATNREIAQQLDLSPHTVKEYVSSVYRKLEVRNRAEAVQRATALGLAA
jgi:DNA-binding NarL/FixJ family response regulator